jgi:hypothetical protein
MKNTAVQKKKESTGDLAAMIMSFWYPQTEDIPLAFKYPSLCESKNFSKELINDITLNSR